MRWEIALRFLSPSEGGFPVEKGISLSPYGRNAASQSIGVCRINAVIASQCAHWRGNPPVRGEMYRQLPYRTGNTAISGGNRYLVPFIGGIATPVCALARNDRKNVQTPIFRTASGGVWAVWIIWVCIICTKLQLKMGKTCDIL